MRINSRCVVATILYRPPRTDAQCIADMHARSLEWSLASTARFSFPSSTRIPPLRPRIDKQVIAPGRIVKEVKEDQIGLVVAAAIDSERKSFYALRSIHSDHSHSSHQHRAEADHVYCDTRSARCVYFDRWNWNRRSVQNQDRWTEIRPCCFRNAVDACWSRTVWIHYTLCYSPSTALDIEHHSQTTRVQRFGSRFYVCRFCRFATFVRFRFGNLEQSEEGIKEGSTNSRESGQGADAYAEGRTERNEGGRNGVGSFCGSDD